MATAGDSLGSLGRSRPGTARLASTAAAARSDQHIEPCWRQHYPRLVLGFASIDASTADSSQLTASDADGVRPVWDGPPPCEAQVDPVEAYSRPRGRQRIELPLLAPA
jgi:hypothetical protein